MKKAVSICLCIGFTLVLMQSVAAAADCSKCDCIHLPCTQPCKPCCGVTTGSVKDVHKFNFTLDNGESFKITAEQSMELKKALQNSSDVTVYYSKSGDQKYAQMVASADDQKNDKHVKQ